MAYSWSHWQKWRCLARFEIQVLSINALFLKAGYGSNRSLIFSTHHYPWPPQSRPSIKWWELDLLFPDDWLTKNYLISKLWIDSEKEAYSQKISSNGRKWWRSGESFLKSLSSTRRPKSIVSFSYELLKANELHSVIVFQFWLLHSISLWSRWQQGQRRSELDREGDFSVQEGPERELGRHF